MSDLTRSRRMILPTVGAIVLAAALTGCHSKPGVYQASTFDNTWNIDGQATEYWKPISGTSLAQPAIRVAVVDFGVEFVTEKADNLFGPDEPEIGLEYTVGAPFSIFGIGKSRIAIDETSKTELPQTLHQQFCQVLRNRGFEVVATPDVVSSPWYATLTGDNTDTKTHLVQLDGTDTGRAHRLETVAASPLLLLDLTQGNKWAIEKLLNTCEADIAVSARFRVGFDEGCATIESGSVIRFDPIAAIGTEPRRVVAHKSLANPYPMPCSKEFEMVTGDACTINGEAFAAAIEEMFPTYAMMAMEASGVERRSVVRPGTLQRNVNYTRNSYSTGNNR